MRLHKILGFLPVVGAFFLSLSAFAISVEQTKLESTMAVNITAVPEFEQIRAEAEKRGLRVWMLGGAAASYAEHAKQNILASGPTVRTAWKLDNFLFPEQDVDLVVTHADGTAETAAEMDEFLKWVETSFPMKADGKSRWDVIGLKTANPGRKKMALETDPNFLDQHNDSLSLGMVEITEPPKGEKIVKDLGGKADFLKDAAGDEMHFIFSPSHQKTAFFLEGRNPPILSAVRTLEKSLRYQKALDSASLSQIKQIIKDWDPAAVTKGAYAFYYLKLRAKRVLTHAVDLPAAERMLGETGLRDKLLKLPGSDPSRVESLAWWLGKKPLPLVAEGGKATGKTAGDLGIHDVYHWTSESNHRLITWNYNDSPRAFESRGTGSAENAALGDGFYTFVNSPEKSRATQATATLAVKMHVSPEAKEGIDFTIDNSFTPPVAVWKSSRYLKVVHDPNLDYPREMTCSGLYRNFTRVTKTEVLRTVKIYGLGMAGATAVAGGGTFLLNKINTTAGFGSLQKSYGCMDKNSIGKEGGCPSLEAFQNSSQAAHAMTQRHAKNPSKSLKGEGESQVDGETVLWIRGGLSLPEQKCVEVMAEEYASDNSKIPPYKSACHGISSFHDQEARTEVRAYQGAKGEDLRQIFRRHELVLDYR